MRNTVVRGHAASSGPQGPGALGRFVQGFIVLIERVAAAWHPAPPHRLVALRLPAPPRHPR